MAPMSRELRARLGASRLLLAKVPGDAFSNASRIQAQAFVSVAKTASLSAQEGADLSSLASDVGFAGADLAAILESLAPRSVEKKQKKRRDMQDYEAMVNYFTEPEWSALQDSGASFMDIRQIIFQRAFDLGARCPNEGTKRMMTCMLLMLTQDMKFPIRHDTKTSTLESVRSAWAVFVRRSTAPSVYIDKLPSSPRVFEREHAALHAVAYGHGATPIPCRLNVALLENLAQTFMCRGNRVGEPSRQPSSSSAAPMLHLEGGSIDRMANCFAEELRRQGERQDRMMEMLLNQQNQPRMPLMDTPGGKRLRCDHELGALQRAGSRRLSLEDGRFQWQGDAASPAGGAPQLTDVDQQTHPSVERDVADADDDALFDEPGDNAVEGSAAVQASPAAAALALAGDSSAAPPAATGGALALLDALEERDAKKKIAAKVAKAQAKLAAERAAAPSASAAQPAAEPTGVGGTKDKKAEQKGPAKDKKAGRAEAPKDKKAEQKGQAKRAMKAAAPKASPVAPAAEVPPAEAPAVVSATASVAELALAAGMQEKVTLNIEHTRTQALVRVGKAPNQRCKLFKWGDKEWHTYRTEEAATTAARAWIATGCKQKE